MIAELGNRGLPGINGKWTETHREEFPYRTADGATLVTDIRRDMPAVRHAGCADRRAKLLNWRDTVDIATGSNCTPNNNLDDPNGEAD